MRPTKAERDAVAEYFESQSGGESVVHLERLVVERVGANVHEVWDVHTGAGGRWWVVAPPMNLYTQADFKSASVVLSFHIGLMARVRTRHEIPLAPEPAELLPESWRRWENAVDAMTRAVEAEDFQSVGMQLRECLIGFAGEVASDELVPEGEQRPQGANVKKWVELLANHLAGGASAQVLRSYLKKTGAETWDYVSWLTHAGNAQVIDAEIGVAAVSHLLSTFTAARMRWSRLSQASRCERCDSYVVAEGECLKCGWIDVGFKPVKVPQPSAEERAAALDTPCEPSSNISTFITPDDF